MFTITRQAVPEPGTLHGQEEHITRTPSSPPSSRAKMTIKNQDRLKQGRKEQRRHKMSSSRNLSPEDAGTTAMDQDPGTPRMSTMPSTGQEMSPNPQQVPRDPPQQPARTMGTHYAHIASHQTSTLSPGKKAPVQIDQPQTGSAAEPEHQQRNVE